MRNIGKRKNIVQYFPKYGCISTGIIYSAIGTLAILSFLKIRHGGADEGSLLALLNHMKAGKIFVWVILSGTVCYIIWRIYEAITDPYGYGGSLRGSLKRIGIALSTIADVLIVYAAIRILSGAADTPLDGKPTEVRNMVRAILKTQDGNWIIIATGLCVFGTAIVQFLYGVTRGYKERINIDRFNHLVKRLIHSFAWFGYFARGVILGIMGFFFVKAGLLHNPEYVVNTDKAFDFIGDHVGHLYFIIIAVGTICYGLFMFAQGATYDTDKD